MTEILTHIKIWFRKNRPELNTEEKEKQAEIAYNEILPYVENVEKGTRIILLNEHLYQNYHYSAYNFVKEVFNEFLPVDYNLFKLTPIFFDLNEGILEEAVDNGLFEYKSLIIGKDKFEDEELKRNLLLIIKKHIA